MTPNMTWSPKIDLLERSQDSKKSFTKNLYYLKKFKLDNYPQTICNFHIHKINIISYYSLYLNQLIVLCSGGI